jgi:uncharacterized protein YwgA
MSTGERKRDVQKVTDIIRDAGGEIVGRTRLQKVAYFLELSGLGEGFPFDYRHYGPYSEALAMAVRNASSLGLVHEDERSTSWGGFYSVYTTSTSSGGSITSARRHLAQEAASADPIELELAATAAFLSKQGNRDPWVTTEKLKPEKSREGNLEKAKALYRKLQRIETPQRLPRIA